MMFFRKRKAKLSESSPAGTPTEQTEQERQLSPATYLTIMLKTAIIVCCLLFFIILPYSFWWVYESGDVALSRVVAKQAQGEFALLGSGVTQDFVDYKLELYKAVRPTIVALGSSRVMQFRDTCFTKKFLNMGGVAGNIPVLRSTLEAMLSVHTPEAVILGLDFWWFMPEWNSNPFKDEPPTKGSYAYTLDTLKKPWLWLLQGKIGPLDLAAPLLGLAGMGFRDTRFGIMAQQTDDGFAPDGSWYYTAETTGQKKPFDYKFDDTLFQVRNGLKAFYYAGDDEDAPSKTHIDAFSEIYCRLRARGIRTYIFIPPLAETVYKEVRQREKYYRHLFTLTDALQDRGIPVIDLTNPRTLGSNDCEFVDGFHGGEIGYLRVLRSLTDQWSSLLAYVNLDCVNKRISGWKGNVYAKDSRVTDLWEIDFNDFGCKKRQKD